MNTPRKILILGAVTLTSLGAYTTAPARDHHGGWHRGGPGWHGNRDWNRGFYRQPRIIIRPAPIYQYSPYYYPSYPYPYYGSNIIIRRHYYHRR